jgi:hypothetical protein
VGEVVCAKVAAEMSVNAIARAQINKSFFIFVSLPIEARACWIMEAIGLAGSSSKKLARSSLRLRFKSFIQLF